MMSIDVTRRWKRRNRVAKTHAHMVRVLVQNEDSERPLFPGKPCGQHRAATPYYALDSVAACVCFAKMHSSRGSDQRVPRVRGREWA